MTITIDRTYFDKHNTEIQYGDILKFDEYPFLDHVEEHYNYYGIVMWSDEDNDVVVRTTVSDNQRVSGISDGNCEYIKSLSYDKHCIDCEIIGNVNNKSDVKKYLRDKSWILEDCIPTENEFNEK